MHSLIIIADPPYGTERCFNALRVAQALLAADDARLTLFLMADGVGAAKAGQKTPPGYYNLEQMLKRVISGGGRVLVCGTCMAARALTDNELIAGSEISNMTELAELMARADHALNF